MGFEDQLMEPLLREDLAAMYLRFSIFRKLPYFSNCGQLKIKGIYWKSVFFFNSDTCWSCSHHCSIDFPNIYQQIPMEATTNQWNWSDHNTPSPPCGFFFTQKTVILQSVKNRKKAWETSETFLTGSWHPHRDQKKQYMNLLKNGSFRNCDKRGLMSTLSTFTL